MANHDHGEEIDALAARDVVGDDIVQHLILMLGDCTDRGNGVHSIPSGLVLHARDLVKEWQEHNRAFINHIVAEQKLKGVTVRVSKQFSNMGDLLFCEAGKFSPFLTVSFSLHDNTSSALAYFKGGRSGSGAGTGCGCTAPGAITQENFGTAETDEALANLATYAESARRGDFSVIPPSRSGIYLCWDTRTRLARARS